MKPQTISWGMEVGMDISICSGQALGNARQQRFHQKSWSPFRDDGRSSSGLCLIAVVVTSPQISSFPSPWVSMDLRKKGSVPSRLGHSFSFLGPGLQEGMLTQDSEKGLTLWRDLSGCFRFLAILIFKTHCIHYNRAMYSRII